MANNTVSEKKKALIVRKEKLLEDIKYYEKRISDFHANKRATSFFEDNCSSDSDEELLVIDNGPSVTQLKLLQSHLKTSLQATQELTNLHLLESEVNVLVTDPDVVDGPQVTEPGVWQEVIAECRLDLVPFSVTFHVHTPYRKFGALSYRNLKVILSKAAHETELAKSVLSYVTAPSDAVEVLRSYSLAHRSRRTTLARLAEKFPSLLFMEPLAEGGYTLKCAGLLEVCWTLQNKWSPIAPFHHRMRFDIEYMDESYIKTITQYHRQLSDPSLETDERTALLSKIINTCLEAKGPTQELYESMESDDPETAQTLRKRRTTLDQEATETAHKKKRDNAIMAPPKSLPKKSKKGKENVDRESYASFKDGISSRSNKNEGKSVGESRLNSVSNRGNNVDVNDETKASERVGSASKDNGKELNSKKGNGKTIRGEVRSSKVVKDIDAVKESVAKSTKENDGRKEPVKSAKDNVKGNTEVRKESAKDKASKDIVKSNKEPKSAKEINKNPAKTSKDNVLDTNKGSQDKVKDNIEVNLKENNVKDNNLNEDGSTDNTKVSKKSTTEKNIEGKKSVAKIAKKSVVSKTKVDAKGKDQGKDQNVDTGKDGAIENGDGKILDKATKSSKIDKINENVEKSVPKKVKKTDDIANVPAKKAKIDQSNKNVPATNENKKKIVTNTKKNEKNATSKKTTENPKNSVINKEKSDPNTLKASNMHNIDKTDVQTKDNAHKKNTTYTKTSETVEKVTENNKISTTKPFLTDIEKNQPKNITNIQKTKTSINNLQDKFKPSKNNVENNKNFNERFRKMSTGNTKLGVKKLSAGNTVKETSAEKISKIPQKLAKVGSSLKKNPLRLSPRKLSLSSKSSQGAKKTIQKPITSIPRLLKKPVVKT